MSESIKTNKESFHIKNCLGYIRSRNRIRDRARILKKHVLNKYIKVSNSKDFVFKELSVNIGPCFDTNETIFNKGQVNIDDANKFLNRLWSSKNKRNCIVEDCARYKKSYSHVENINKDKGEPKSVQSDTLNGNKQVLDSNQAKLDPLHKSPQLKVVLIDCIRYLTMEPRLSTDEGKVPSEPFNKITDSDANVDGTTEEIEKKLNDFTDTVSAKSNEGDKILKEDRNQPETISLDESFKSKSIDSLDKKDTDALQKEENCKVQFPKEVLDKRKMKEHSSITKASREVQKVHSNLKIIKSGHDKRKKHSNVKKSYEQNLVSRKSRTSLKNDLSNKYTSKISSNKYSSKVSTSKPLLNYKSPLKKSVSEKIKGLRDKKYSSRVSCNRPSHSESAHRKKSKDIMKIFMSAGQSSFESDMTSQSENEIESASSKAAFNKVHNTRKTHPSYAKIRVKSQEALGVRSVSSKPKSTELKKHADVKINAISNVDKIPEKDPLALDSPKEETIPILEKRSRGRPSLNGKRKNLHDKSLSMSQPIIKRIYKSSSKEVKQCRLCGELATDYLDVFSPSADDMNLLEKIKEYLVVTITKDELSKHACIACTTMVVNWANFYLRCKEINKQFLSKQDESSLSTVDINTEEKTSIKVDPVTSSIKKEYESEDNIEKMLREMHGMDKEENGLEDVEKVTTEKVNTESNPHLELLDDSDMNVEFLEEEKDLVDEALLYQKMKIQKSSYASKGDSKVIRMDRKLSEQELRELMNKHNVTTNSVVVLKVDSKQNFNNEDIKNTLKDLKERRQRMKKTHRDGPNDGNVDKEYYVQLAKTYAHQHLESIQTATETHYKCLDCRAYVAGSQMPRHCLEKHGKMNALCDFCSLLLPYNTEEEKALVKEHIDLHDLKKSKTHPDVIINTSKLLQNGLMTKAGYFASNFEELKSSRSNLKTDIVEIQKGSSGAVVGENLPEKRKQNRYRCKICQQKFSTVSLLRDHNMIQHTSIKLECEFCFEMFSTKQNLVNHIKIKHPDTTENSQWICEGCGQTFGKQEEYIQHKIAEHNMSKPEVFVCLHCEKRFKSVENLREHVRTHKSLLCEICGETFKTRLSVRSHKRCVHNINMHPCPHCDYVAVSSARLKIHVRLHNAFAAFSCEQCDASFYTTKRLRDHIQHQHIDQKDVRKYNCPLCDWAFHVEVNLKKHFEVHVEKGHITCKVCQEKFEQAGDTLEMNDILKHKEKHTEQENMVFKRPYSPSVSRMKSWSNGGTPGARAVCRDCGLTFATPNELRKHHKIHKPFYCEICKTLSNNEQTYNQHMDQHSERKHGCKTCGKMFMTRPALGLHMRTHVKEPKHQCKVCQRKFLLTADWRRHERVCRVKYGYPDQSDLRSATFKFNYKKSNLSQEYTIINNIKTVMTEDGRQILYECTPDDVLENTSKEGMFQHLATDEQGEIQPNDFVQLIIENDESNTTDVDETIEIDESELLAFREWQKAIAQEKKNKPATQNLTDHYILPDRTYIYQTESNTGNEDEISSEHCTVDIEPDKFPHAVISTRYNIENKPKMIGSLNMSTNSNRNNLNSELEENVIFSEPPYVLETDRAQIIISQNPRLSNDNYVFSNDIVSQEMILNESADDIILKENDNNVHGFSETSHFNKTKNIQMDTEENLNLSLEKDETVRAECFSQSSIAFNDNTNGAVPENTIFEKDGKEFIGDETSSPGDKRQPNMTSVSYVMQNQNGSNSHSDGTAAYLQEKSNAGQEITEISDQICEVPSGTSLKVIEAEENYVMLEN